MFDFIEGIMEEFVAELIIFFYYRVGKRYIKKITR